MSAPAGGGLAEVLAVLAEATPGEWRAQAERAIVILGGNAGGFCIADCPHAGDNATAIVAAVNYLRSHGAAIAELIAADKEYDAAREAYSAKAPSGIGELDSRTDEDYERLRAARARRLAALSNIEGASHG